MDAEIVGNTRSKVYRIRQTNLIMKEQQPMDKTYPYQTMPAPAPQCAPPPPIRGCVPTSDELRAMADKQDAQIALDAERAATGARIEHELGLVEATRCLLTEVQTRLYGVSTSQPAMSRYFAEYRKELAPLALTYGYKIVLVSDKSLAALVQV